MHVESFSDVSPVKRGKIDSTTKKLSKAAALAETFVLRPYDRRIRCLI
jgi:hypothetical protein